MTKDLIILIQDYDKCITFYLGGYICTMNALRYTSCVHCFKSRFIKSIIGNMSIQVAFESILLII